MTREDYIKAVKVKLEEISPFEEPDNFIADTDNLASSVKPIISYIDKSLDEATHNCLNALPLSLLHADIVHVTSTGAASGTIEMEIDKDGVGRFSIPQGIRLIRFRHDALKRDITAFITTEDPLYLLQQNKYTRGGTAKPVAVWSSDDDEVQIYSFPESMKTDVGAEDTSAILLGIDTTRHPDNRSTTEPAYTDTSYVKSPIEEYIILECAAMVSEILGNADAATIFRNQIQSKIQATLQ